MIVSDPTDTADKCLGCAGCTKRDQDDRRVRPPDHQRAILIFEQSTALLDDRFFAMDRPRVGL